MSSYSREIDENLGLGDSILADALSLPGLGDEVVARLMEVDRANASELEQVNILLLQLRQILENSPDKLDEEGVLRVSADANDVEAAFLNPKQFLETEDVHLQIGVIKKAIKNFCGSKGATSDVSEEVKTIINDFRGNISNEGFIIGNSKNVIPDLIADLRNKNAVDEAMLIEQLMQLGHKVTTHSEENKMGDKGVGVIIGAQLNNLLDAMVPSPALSAGETRRMAGLYPQITEYSFKNNKVLYNKPSDETVVSNLLNKVEPAPSHPLVPLIELLNNVDTSDNESIIQFVKENKKFQLQMQDTLLKDHINRQRVEQGKQAKDMLEIGADDAVPFRIGLVLDYLSTLESSDAEQLCEKIITISEKTYEALLQRDVSRKVGVELWGEEHGFLTSLETAFEASKSFEFKFPEDDDNLLEVNKTICLLTGDNDKLLEVNESLHLLAESQKVLVEYNKVKDLVTDTLELQQKVLKAPGSETRQQMQFNLDEHLDNIYQLVEENPATLKIKGSDDHNLLYHAMMAKNNNLVNHLLRQGCLAQDMGITENDIESDYRLDRKGKPLKYQGLDGSERNLEWFERFLQLKSPETFAIYQIQQLMPIIDDLDADGLKTLLESRAGSGLNPNLKINAKGDTFAHVVCRTENVEMIKVLLDYQFPDNQDISFSVKNDAGEQLHDLLPEASEFKQKTKQEAAVIDLHTILLHQPDAFEAALVQAIDEGFKINGQYGTRGQTLLQKCVSSTHDIQDEKYHSILTVFKDNGADFNAPDKQGETPLMTAARVPNFPIDKFKILVDDFGANVNILSDKNRSILLLSLGTGNSNKGITEYMLDHIEKFGLKYETPDGDMVDFIALPDKHGMTPMHYIIDTGDKDLIERALNLGADLTLDLSDWVDYENKAKNDRVGYSLIHYAAEKFSPENFEIILQKYKGQLEVKFINENLHLDSDARNKAFEEYYNEALNELDNELGFTVMHAALHNGSHAKEIVDILKSNGAKINLENTATGQSYSARSMIPLGKALNAEAPFDMTRKLVSQEILAHRFSNNGRTPLLMTLDSMVGKSSVSVEKGQKKAKNTFSLDKAWGLDSKCQLLEHMIVLANNDNKMFEQFDSQGNSALHYAMRILANPLSESQSDILNQVIIKGMSVENALEAKNTDGKSPLDVLAESVTGHFSHDILPKSLHDDLKAKGALDEPIMEEYSLGSLTEPFVILSEGKETTLLQEILLKQEPGALIPTIELLLMNKPELQQDLADCLLNKREDGTTLLGDIIKSNNNASHAFAMSHVDPADPRLKDSMPSVQVAEKKPSLWARFRKAVSRFFSSNKQEVSEPDIIEPEVELVQPDPEKLEQISEIEIENSNKSSRRVRFGGIGDEDTEPDLEHALKDRPEVDSERKFKKGDESGLSVQKAKDNLQTSPKKSILKKPESAGLLPAKQQMTFMSDSAVGVKNKRPDPISSKDLLIQQCINDLQNALDWKISVGKLPNFCQPDVSVQAAKEAIESMQEKLIEMGDADGISGKDIKAAVFEVGAGTVFKAESPIKSLSDSMDALQSAKSKIKPGGGSAPAA